MPKNLFIFSLELCKSLPIFAPGSFVIVISISEQQKFCREIQISAIKTVKSAINPEIGDKKQQILAFISSHGEVKADAVAKHIGLGASRTRDYLKQLVEEGKLLAMGANKNRTYKLR